MLAVGDRYRAKKEPAPDFVENVHSAVRRTLESLDAGFHAHGAFPDRVLTVMYELLVGAPQIIIKQMCEFVGVSFVPQMLQPHTIKHPNQDEIAQLDNGTWLDPSLGFRPIEKSRINAWQHGLDAEHVRIVNAAFRNHETLRQLGYEFND
jgi:hypothetical protein